MNARKNKQEKEALSFSDRLYKILNKQRTMNLKNASVAFVLLSMALSVSAQDKLYPQMFPLEDVKITGGTFMPAT